MTTDLERGWVSQTDLTTPKVCKKFTNNFLLYVRFFFFFRVWYSHFESLKSVLLKWGSLVVGLVLCLVVVVGDHGEGE